MEEKKVKDKMMVEEKVKEKEKPCRGVIHSRQKSGV
jgi:hypothetical protein